MRKLLLLATGLALCSTMAEAKDITPSQARAIAAKYVTVGQAKKMRQFKAPAAGNTAAAPDFYAFNDAHGNGFVLIAGDDCVTPVLGYSTTGSFSQDDMAPAFKAWLDAVSADITAMRTSGNGTAKTADADANDQPTIVVAPLIKTQWNQRTPYNDQTPTIGGAHAMTGCVATALAQVMKYYEWPVTGTGSVHYDTPTYDSKTIDVDFTKSTYDWANMRDTYTTTDGTPGWNEAEGNAVAMLMHDIGAAIHMQYGTQSSGSWNSDIVNTVSRHFGYNATNYKKANYNTGEWMTLIKQQLDAHNPLAYAGQEKNGGHEFVVDGYDSNDYMHVNWGWSGNGDGYFTFHKFGTGTYSFTQSMSFVVMTPNKTGIAQTETPVATNVVWYIGEDGNDVKSVDADKADFAAHVTISIQHTSWKNLDAEMRYTLKDAAGNIVKTWGEGTIATTSAAEATKTGLDITGETLDGIADGTYSMAMQFRDKRTDGTRFDEWSDGLLLLCNLNVTISNGHITLQAHYINNAPVVVKSFTLDKTDIDFGDNITWQASLDTSNDEDNIANNIVIVFENTDDPDAKLVYADKAEISVFHGIDNTFSQNVSIIATDRLREGHYKVYLIVADANGYYRPEIPGGAIPVSVKFNNAKYAMAYVDKATVTLDCGDMGTKKLDATSDEVHYIDMSDESGAEELLFDLDVKWNVPETVPAPYFVYYYLLATVEGNDPVNLNTETGESNVDTPLKLSALVYDDVFDEKNYGKLITWSVCYSVPYARLMPVMNDKNGNQFTFKTCIYDKTTGISDITTKAQPTERFDIQGRRIAEPAKGINIVRMSDGKVKKVLVK